MSRSSRWAVSWEQFPMSFHHFHTNLLHFVNKKLMNNVPYVSQVMYVRDYTVVFLPAKGAFVPVWLKLWDRKFRGWGSVSCVECGADNTMYDLGPPFILHARWKFLPDSLILSSLQTREVWTVVQLSKSLCLPLLLCVCVTWIHYKESISVSILWVCVSNLSHVDAFHSSLVSKSLFKVIF